MDIKDLKPRRYRYGITRYPHDPLRTWAGWLVVIGIVALLGWFVFNV